MFDGIGGLNCLNAMIPTWPEQCEGTPTSGCSSKTETEAPFWAAARAVVAPLTPHPTTATSTSLEGKIHLLTLALYDPEEPEASEEGQHSILWHVVLRVLPCVCLSFGVKP